MALIRHVFYHQCCTIWFRDGCGVVPYRGRAAVWPSCLHQLPQHLKAICGQGSERAGRSLPNMFTVHRQGYAHLTDRQVKLPITKGVKQELLVDVHPPSWRPGNYCSEHWPCGSCHRRACGPEAGQRSAPAPLLCSPGWSTAGFSFQLKTEKNDSAMYLSRQVEKKWVQKQNPF